MGKYGQWLLKKVEEKMSKSFCTFDDHRDKIKMSLVADSLFNGI